MPGINVTLPPPGIAYFCKLATHQRFQERKFKGENRAIPPPPPSREREREREVRRYVISVVSSFAFITLDRAIFPPNSSLQTIVRGF